MTTLGNRRARLVEYVRWMARDYMTNQGLATAIVILLIGITIIAPASRGFAVGAGQLGQVPRELAAQVLRVLITPVVFIGVLFATNGIIANDRKFGYYRFLFSKPLSPPAYYAVVFLVHGAGLLLVCLVMAGLWFVAVSPVFPYEVLLVMAIMYVAYGGVGFLLSAAWRFDWLSLVTVLFLANVGWSVWGTAQGLQHWLLYLLPPVHRANDFYSILGSATRPMPWPSVLWLFGYGFVCFILGMMVIRRRPLGTS